MIGDFSWFPIVLKQWKTVVTNWCRFAHTDTNRINRRVFVWADKLRLKHRYARNWNYFIEKNFLNLNHYSTSLIRNMLFIWLYLNGLFFN